MSGAKIIDGLKDAVAGNFSRVHIEGQTWVRQDWQDISTAPKDGTPFLAWQDGEIYHARYTNDPKPRLTFRAHSLFVSEKHRYVDAKLDGEVVRALAPIDMPWKEEFRHDWTIWTRGFDFNPTHWMPLPSPPREGER